MKTQIEAINAVYRDGNFIVVGGLMTREIINYNCKVNLETINFLTGSEEEYVQNKMIEINHSVKSAINHMKIDLLTRRAVVQFNLEGDEPNCMVSLQFLWRYNKMHVIVYQRSSDVKDKLAQDIEIIKRIVTEFLREFKTSRVEIYYTIGSAHYYM